MLTLVGMFLPPLLRSFSPMDLERPLPSLPFLSSSFPSSQIVMLSPFNAMCVPSSSGCCFWPHQPFFTSTLLIPQLWFLAFSATLTPMRIWLKPGIFSIHLPTWKLHVHTYTKTNVVVWGPPNYPWNPMFHSFLSKSTNLVLPCINM